MFGVVPGIEVERKAKKKLEKQEMNEKQGFTVRRSWEWKKKETAEKRRGERQSNSSGQHE